MILKPVTGEDARVLYELLSERTPEQSISHKRMPPLAEHAAFVLDHMTHQPHYQAWYTIHTDEVVGSIYLTHMREIGHLHLQEIPGRRLRSERYQASDGKTPR